jgi:hypothetical protein
LLIISMPLRTYSSSPRVLPTLRIYCVAGKEVNFRDLGPGEVFGEYAAIDRSPRSASVETRPGRAGPNERGHGPPPGITMQFY